MFNRKSVIDALKQVKFILQSQPGNHPKRGLIIYSTAETSYVIDDEQLPRRVNHSTYSCGSTFDTTILENILKCSNGPLYGIVIIDGDDTLFATSKGNLGNEHISILKTFSSHIRGRCRRGGQSALRFDRLRDDAEAKYVLRAVEETKCLIDQDCDAYLIGGKANLKNLYGEQIKVDVLGYFNTSCGKEPGLRELLEKSKQVRDRYENDAEYTFIDLFNKQLVNDPDKIVFGMKECIRYSNLGMVDTILASANIKPRAKEKLKELCEQYSSKLIEIRGITGDGSSFCNEYKIVGFLRYSF